MGPAVKPQDDDKDVAPQLSRHLSPSRSATRSPMQRRMAGGSRRTRLIAAGAFVLVLAVVLLAPGAGVPFLDILHVGAPILVLLLAAWAIWRQGWKFALIYVSLLLAAPILFVAALSTGLTSFQRDFPLSFSEVRLAIFIAGALVMVACFRPVGRMIPEILFYGAWVWLTPALLLATACMTGGGCL